jgi:glycosyltransferase involved in cell wall biosynthesis
MDIHIKNYLLNIIYRIGLIFSRDNNRNTKISILREFVKPPFGGGNQFMLALKNELGKNSNIKVFNNIVHESVDCYIVDSIWLDTRLLSMLDKMSDIKLIHRIDGPIHLYRGKDKNIDDDIFKLNSKYATSTVIQSEYTYNKLIDVGYHPVNPFIIRNAVNSDIFNRAGKSVFENINKIKLISTSWSTNKMKGGDIYKWIDENLDWHKFEYIFVGRSSETFKNIQLIDAVNSEKLSEYLKNSDIYITASQNDPCSNALIEALSCGLPALYINSGGHPELVKDGGEAFENVNDLLKSLYKIVDHYYDYQKKIKADSINVITRKYLELID